MTRPITALSLAASLLCAAGTVAAADATYARTKYPIVLTHGIAGFGSIGPVDYFYGLPADLQANGAKVFTTSVSAFASSEVRGEQLLKQTKDILALTGAAKVNLIGHSHGNQSIRYVAALIPTRIASATSVGGVTKGSAVADAIKQATQLPVVGAAGSAPLVAIVNGFGALIGAAQGQQLPQDALASLDSLTTAGAAAFNARFPAGVPGSACGEGAYSANGVRFYSWGGTGVLTNAADLLDPFFASTSVAFIGKADSQNDGLVGRCSNHFGQVLRDNYSMNHADEVNHLFGLTSIFESSPLTVYRGHANRLKLAGF